MGKDTRYNWRYIPRRMRWAATDADGERYVYVQRPVLGTDAWTSEGESLEYDFDVLGQWCAVQPCKGWRKTLEERPAKKGRKGR